MYILQNAFFKYYYLSFMIRVEYIKLINKSQLTNLGKIPEFRECVQYKFIIYVLVD